MGCTEKNLLENDGNGNTDKPLFAASGGVGVNLDQFANGTPKPNPPAWQNGDLNGNNSAYPPDGSVPFRLSVTGLSAGQHTIHINYDWTAGGHHAYDFLASVDAFITGVNVCAPNGGSGALPSPLCSGSGNSAALTAFATANTDFEPFPADPFTDVTSLSVNGAIAASSQLTGGAVTSTYAAGNARSLIIFGGTIGGIGNVAHAGPTTGNSTGDMLVTFSTTNCTSNCSVFLVWSGHLADDQGGNAYWNQAATPPGPADGASQISGAPWHMRTQQLDASGNKNQDRSIQPSAIVVENPNLQIVKTPDAGTINGGDKITFTITVSNTGAGPATNVTLIDTLPIGNGVTTYTVKTQTNVSGCTITTGALLEQILNCSKSSLATGTDFSVVVESNATTSASCGIKYDNPFARAKADNNGEVTDAGDVTVNCPDLSITKTPDGGTVNAGDKISFTITVTNNGTGPATNVTLVDTLPLGSGVTTYTVKTETNVSGCTIGTDAALRQILSCSKSSLAAGASFSVVVESNATTSASCKQYLNKAHADADNDDEITDDGDVTVDCPVLGIDKTPHSQTVDASIANSFSWTVTLTNNGPGTASNAEITDTLPVIAGVTYSTSSGDCTVEDGALGERIFHCGPKDLAVNGTLSGVVDVTTTARAGCGAYSNTAHGAGTGLTDVKFTANVTLSGCTKGQILPTQSTCSSFTGSDPSLLQLQATIVKGKINNVTPGVWFYFLSVIAPSSSFTVNIREDNDGGLDNFQINNGQVNVYTDACATFNTATVTLVTPGDPTGADVAFTGATAGNTYVIGVKYANGTTLDGQPGNLIPQGGVVYSYTTQINGGAAITENTATVTLVKK
jgi:uncharacterized repeat protein (TIGR01451 family)